MTRRRLTTWALLAAFLLLVGSGLCLWVRPVRPVAGKRPGTPDEALAELRSGNERFVSCRRVLSADTAGDALWRLDIAKKQRPFAALLCCSDSRVCPELIFDQRPGSLFEVRNAGNVVDEDVMGSLEYAVEHLHVPLVVVMGHKGCGAVEAVRAAHGKPLPAHLRALQDHMPGLRHFVVRPGPRRGPESLDWLARENARQQAATLRRESTPIQEAVARGASRLVVAMYDLETGEITFDDG